MSNTEIPQRNAEDMGVTLEEWYKLKVQLDSLKLKELTLRKAIHEFYFPDAEEGTSSIDIGGGFVLKAVTKYNYRIDEGALEAVKPKLEDLGVAPPVRYKIELDTKPYRALKGEAEEVFGEALIIKPGTPTLSIVKPKK